jgi:protein-tyrosine-phosphatase
MEEEVRTQIAEVQEQSVAPVTPTEQTATPIVEPAATSQESKETADKEVSKGVQKRIDQVTAKFYAALDESKKAAARTKELEEENARLKNGTPAKEVSMFEGDDADENDKVSKLEQVVNGLRKEQEATAQKVRYDSFAEFVGEMRGKYAGITDEESIHIIEELNKDDVPPEAHGAIEKYFAAHELNTVRSQLAEREIKVERKQAVTEGKSVVANEHFPDDPMEALELLKSDPAKYEELAKKSGRRG